MTFSKEAVQKLEKHAIDNEKEAGGS